MKLTSQLKVAAGSSGLILIGLFVGWIIFPPIFKLHLKKTKALIKGNDVRAIWEQVPFSVPIRFWLFNFTNAAEVQKGAKPIVQEIGPYYFDQYKSKVEIQEDEKADTITHRRLSGLYFRKDLSGPGLTGEEVITQPDTIMVSVGLATAIQKPALLRLVNKAIDGLWNKPKDLFITAPALDLLFRGTTIDCDRTDFAPKAVCSVLKELTAMEYLPNKQIKFSFFGQRNFTPDPNQVTIIRGSKNIMDVGKIVAINGKSEVEMWRDNCNKFKGTDTTIVRPFYKKNDVIVVYSTDLWRIFKFSFQKEFTTKGIKLYRYVSDMGVYEDPDLICICDKPDICPRKGIMDLINTGTGPVQASMPHFYGCENTVLDQLIGVQPDPEKHRLHIDLEPISGTITGYQYSLQINIPLTKISELDMFQNLPGTTVPLLYFKENFALNEAYILALKVKMISPRKVMTVISSVTIIIGFMGLSVSIFYKSIKECLKKVEYAAEVTNVNPKNQGNMQQSKEVDMK